MTTPASPRPAASWVDRHARWPVLGGVIMGAAHLHPTLAPLAWIGLGVFAWGLSRLEGRVNRALAIFGGLWASVFLSQIWLCLTITKYMGPLVGSDEAPLWLSALAWVFAAVITASHRALPVIVAALVLWRAPMRWWLPAAVLAGESLNGALGFTMADLMHSQWAVPAMLRSVALIGVPATGLLCAYAVVAVADALREGRRGLVAAVPVALWLGLVPPTPADDEALAGVAAIHLADFERRPSPAELPAEEDLVLWPEAAFRGAFRRWEGTQDPPLPLDALAGWSGPQHIVNLRLKRPGQIQNAIGVTDGEGQVTALRGKSSLVPWGERPYGGIDPLFSIDVAGTVPPMMRTAAGPVVPTICYEVYERSLFIEGAALGGELLVNVANDGAYGPTALGVRQAIGVLALSAAGTHRPAARASISGQAALISSTGAVLAVSEPGTSGALVWNRPNPAAKGAASPAQVADRRLNPDNDG
ncbi:hypothetical protein L6R46_11915, partial [Myxococcota bacterium]|nr:hypothetical protein [Myxococcota bacterium]